jgi:ABC-type dipeptide/oligopeptide/nickel transport system permease component
MVLIGFSTPTFWLGIILQIVFGLNLINLAVDFAYAYLDPRIHYG